MTLYNFWSWAQLCNYYIQGRGWKVRVFYMIYLRNKERVDQIIAGDLCVCALPSPCGGMVVSTMQTPLMQCHSWSVHSGRLGHFTCGTFSQRNPPYIVYVSDMIVDFILKEKKLNVSRAIASRVCPNLLLMLPEKNVTFITVFGFRIWVTEIWCSLELKDIGAHGHFSEDYMIMIWNLHQLAPLPLLVNSKRTNLCRH